MMDVVLIPGLLVFSVVVVVGTEHSHGAAARYEGLCRCVLYSACAADFAVPPLFALPGSECRRVTASEKIKSAARRFDMVPSSRRRLGPTRRPS